MEVNVQTNAVTVVLTLTRVELLHLEAALDEFTDLTPSDAKDRMGLYSKEYDSDLAYQLWDGIDNIRDEIGAHKEETAS